MVDYNATESVLELGDDDALSVGDYEIEYDSTSGNFAVNHPNGETSTVPKNRSGSLVPQGLAESVSEGKALADDGEMYDSVQTAVDNASGWVFVGSGTFNESVTIDRTGLTLEGCGEDTLINGGATGHAIDVQAYNVTIRNLSVQTTAGAGNAYNGIYSSTDANSGTVENCYVRESDEYGICPGNGADWIIKNCKVTNVDSTGITGSTTPRMIITGCIVENSGDSCISVREDGIVANCIARNPTKNGIQVKQNDSICIGNRVINAGNDGISVNGADNIVANNRISDSASFDIDDGGTGTVLDDNLTGPSN